MDTNHFVLSVASFMVIVTVIFAVSQWEFEPAPLALQRVTCKFDSICRGTDCSGKLPDDIIIVAKSPEGAFYTTVGDDFDRTALETVTDREWVMRNDKTGKVRFKIDENGALSVTETAGLDADSAVLATATGVCTEADQTSREQS